MKHPSSYLRMKIMGAIEFAEGNSIKEKIQKVSEMVFLDEEGNPRKFTWRTISTWYYRYKSQGITGVQSKKRKDIGKTRKITPEDLMSAIEQVLPLFRAKNNFNKSELYKACIEKGLIRRENLAPTTFYRIVRENELLKNKGINPKLREAWSKQYANQLWQADTMFGPFIKHHGQNIRTKLIAFIDDASRVVTHAEFFLNENVDTLIQAIKSALYKRGIPEQLYVDNGSIYTSKEIRLICARLGILLSHTPIRDGAAKGKIERFFRTVRMNFLCRNLSLDSIEKLNQQFTLWLEENYNAKEHSTIGMKPIDRFGLDLKRIRFLSPNPAHEEIFFCEENRKVKKDNTFNFKNKRFEAPANLRQKQIQIRFSRKYLKTVIVYFKDRRIGIARSVNFIFNSNAHRKTLKKEN